MVQGCVCVSETVSANTAAASSHTEFNKVYFLLSKVSSKQQQRECAIFIELSSSAITKFPQAITFPFQLWQLQGFCAKHDISFVCWTWLMMHFFPANREQNKTKKSPRQLSMVWHVSGWVGRSLLARSNAWGSEKFCSFRQNQNSGAFLVKVRRHLYRYDVHWNIAFKIFLVDTV